MLLPAMLRLLHTVLGRNMLVLLMLRSRWQGQQKQHMLQQSEDRRNRQQATHLVLLALPPHKRWQQRQPQQRYNPRAPPSREQVLGRRLLLLCIAPLWAAHEQPVAAHSSCWRP